MVRVREKVRDMVRRGPRRGKIKLLGSTKLSLTKQQYDVIDEALRLFAADKEQLAFEESLKEGLSHGDRIRWAAEAESWERASFTIRHLPGLRVIVRGG